MVFYNLVCFLPINIIQPFNIRIADDIVNIIAALFRIHVHPAHKCIPHKSIFLISSNKAVDRFSNKIRFYQNVEWKQCTPGIPDSVMIVHHRGMLRIPRNIPCSVARHTHAMIHRSIEFRFFFVADIISNAEFTQFPIPDLLRFSIY